MYINVLFAFFIWFISIDFVYFIFDMKLPTFSEICSEVFPILCFFINKIRKKKENKK